MPPLPTPTCPTIAFTKLLTDPDFQLRKAAAANPALSNREMEQLISES
jgi:hypothetical protein